MNDLVVVAAHTQHVVLGLSATLAHQIATRLALTHEQGGRFVAADGAVKVALVGGLLGAQRILEHEYGAVELVAQRLLHDEVLDEFGECGELIAAVVADVIAAVGVVLYLDVLEQVVAAHRERVAVGVALRCAYQKAAVLAEVAQKLLGLQTGHIPMKPAIHKPNNIVSWCEDLT